MTFRPLDFAEILSESGKRYSDSTIKLYSSCLESLESTLKRVVKGGVESASLHHITSFLRKVREEGLSFHYVWSYYQAVKAFGDALKRLGFLTKNPVSGYSPLKDGASLKPDFSEALGTKDLDRIVEEAAPSAGTTTPTDVRDFLIVGTARYLGLAPREFVSLGVGDLFLDCKDPFFVVKASGSRKSREVPINSNFVSPLRDNLPYWLRARGVESDFVFTAKYKETPVSFRQLEALFHEYGTTAMQVRRSLGKELRENGMPVREAAKFFGITPRYIFGYGEKSR